MEMSKKKVIPVRPNYIVLSNESEPLEGKYIIKNILTTEEFDATEEAFRFLENVDGCTPLEEIDGYTEELYQEMEDYNLIRSVGQKIEIIRDHDNDDIYIRLLGIKAKSPIKERILKIISLVGTVIAIPLFAYAGLQYFGNSVLWICIFLFVQFQWRWLMGIPLSILCGIIIKMIEWVSLEAYGKIEDIGIKISKKLKDIHIGERIYPEDNQSRIAKISIRISDVKAYLLMGASGMLFLKNVFGVSREVYLFWGPSIMFCTILMFGMIGYVIISESVCFMRNIIKKICIKHP